MDIPHIKLFTQDMLTCIPTQSFDKKHDRSNIIKALGYKPAKSNHTCRISLLLTLVLSSALDLCNNKDILLVVGFNYNFQHIVKTHDRSSTGVEPS